MTQCVTEATATLYGETVVTPTAQLSTSLREEVQTVVEPNSFVLTSSCQGGGGVPEVSATTENLDCSTWSYPVVTTRTVTSTFTDVATLDGPGSPVTSSFPTETQYKTSCETIKNTPTPTVIATQALVATTLYSVSVSSTEVPITVPNGEVSVSLLLETISILVTATATVIQNVTITPSPTEQSSSSTPVAAIAGAAAGGAIALTAIIVGLLFFLRRKKKRRVVAASDEDEDGRYGAIGADGFPAAGKGGSVKKKRLDLVDSDGNGSNPGPIEPFTYTSPSFAAVPIFEPLPRNQAYSPIPQGPNAASASASPPSTSPNPSIHGHSSSYFPLGANSPPPSGSPPATTSSRETKPSEAQRRRTMGGNNSGVASSSSSTWAGSRFDEDTVRSPGEEQMSPILVHQDAGPVPEELPPVYANRGGGGGA